MRFLKSKSIIISLVCFAGLSTGAGCKRVDVSSPRITSINDCTTSNPKTIAIRATIVNSGNTLTDDGKGPYDDLVDGVRVPLENALALFTFRPAGTITAPVRSMSLDLNKPVPSRGGTPMGIFVDNKAAFSSFWYVDSKNFVHGLQDVPIGKTVDSDRTQMWITSQFDGHRYSLQMGPWSNQCEPFGFTDNTGSTKAKITRNSATEWTVYAPPGSIGHLSNYWNAAPGDQSMPVSIGLYYVSFLVKAVVK